ncbi:hypothetical protein Premu_0073 [Hallella multisaccharivorax DSM 17128]|uniref:Uncharacterized protein n=1 Tax=Hallella multisaccharivorax DSM 17128 TaxID=688246 RepID=F8N5A8_9BACT|nr:hypothetical protein Premu_0073 [Hallella multisaccharivorax DSM 17128]
MIYTDKDFVLLYAHNVPVKGDDEGVIYDLQKEDFCTSRLTLLMCSTILGN